MLPPKLTRRHRLELRFSLNHALTIEIEMDVDAVRAVAAAVAVASRTPNTRPLAPNRDLRISSRHSALLCNKK
jgi:hypothetical protein